MIHTYLNASYNTYLIKSYLLIYVVNRNYFPDPATPCKHPIKFYGQ